MQCTAKSKRSGQQCKGRAVTGKTKCRMHGGTTPSGYGLPQTKTGRYSKVLPLRLAARYHAALANKDLLSLKDDIAACESRLGDLFQRVDTGESGMRWQAMCTALDTFSAALAVCDAATTSEQLTQMQQLARHGREDYTAWAEILRAWETRCKLTATQARVLVAAQQMISTEQLMVYFGVITDAIQRSVSAHADPPVARAILGDLSQEFHKISLRESGADA